MGQAFGALATFELLRRPAVFFTATVAVVAGYALWQISDDSGGDLPRQLKGRRDRALGLGPEVNVLVPSLQAKLVLRYTRDFGVEGRPEAQLIVLGMAVRMPVVMSGAPARP